MWVNVVAAQADNLRIQFRFDEREAAALGKKIVIMNMLEDGIWIRKATEDDDEHKVRQITHTPGSASVNFPWSTVTGVKPKFVTQADKVDAKIKDGWLTYPGVNILLQTERKKRVVKRSRKAAAKPQEQGASLDLFRQAVAYINNNADELGVTMGLQSDEDGRQHLQAMIELG